MDPVALEALAKQVGEKRKADAAPAAGALSAPSTLSEIHSNASALNAANPEVLQAVLGAGEAGGAALKSDADEQLLVSLNLPQTFKLSAIKIAGPADGSAPATIKLFANKQSMSFDDCEDFCPTQTLTISSAEATIPLQLTKFSNVSSLSGTLGSSALEMHPPAAYALSRSHPTGACRVVRSLHRDQPGRRGVHPAHEPLARRRARAHDQHERPQEVRLMLSGRWLMAIP